MWLGWFLHTNIWEFARLADLRGEHQRAEMWRLHVSALKAALELKAWDGEWYRRAYFDDGTPLGSATNAECRIDSIAQSWGVISGAAEPARGARAMAAVEKYLVRRGEGLVLLFTPPFDQASPDPGYIKGYLPGVRENGGQYTYGLSVLAFAALSAEIRPANFFSLLNPINHAVPAPVYRYKVEPYVVAADIYAESPHAGRGGWTWYTGSGMDVSGWHRGYWVSVCRQRPISTLVSTRGRALRSHSAITRRATKSLSKTHMELSEEWRLLNSMAHRSQAAHLSRWPMTA